MHREIYKLYKYSGPWYCTCCTHVLQPWAFRFIRFVNYLCLSSILLKVGIAGVHTVANTTNIWLSWDIIYHYISLYVSDIKASSCGILIDITMQTVVYILLPCINNPVHFTGGICFQASSFIHVQNYVCKSLCC